MLQRQRGQQREADHHAKRDDRQRYDVLAGRAPLPEGKQEAKRDNAGNGRTCHREEDRVELLHGDARGRQRSAENDHPDKTVDQSARRPVHFALPSIAGPYPALRLAAPVTVRYS